MKSPPILQDHSRDQDLEADAQRQVNEAERQGREIIRSHLQSHISHNPGRSSDYVTWIATLHPENAEVTIDKRFLIPGNPWWTIYEEAKTDTPLFPASAVSAGPGSSGTASVDDTTVGADPNGHTGVQSGQADAEQAGVVKDGVSASVHPPEPHIPHVCLRCSPVNVFIGVFVWFFAVLGVVIVEVLSLVAYVIGAAFYLMARPFDPPGPCTAFFYNLFMVVYQLVAFIDSLCLIVSTLVSEVVAATSWIAVVCFGGIWMANYHHQNIRVSCHVIRSAFRSHWKYPPRHFVLCCTSPAGSNDVVVREVHGLDDACVDGSRDPEKNTPTAAHIPQSRICTVQAPDSRQPSTDPLGSPQWNDAARVVVVPESDVVVENHAGMEDGKPSVRN